MNKTITENKKNATEYFDYKTEIRKRQEEERKHLEKWRKEIKSMSIYNSNHHPNVYGGRGFGAITDDLPGKYGNISVVANNIPTGLKVEGTIEVQGRDILKELDEMRDALLLLKRDVDMEAKYPRLKELKDEYEKALEKYKTFDRIKESK